MRPVTLATIAGSAVLFVALPVSASMSPVVAPQIPTVRDSGAQLPAERPVNEKGRDSKERIVDAIKEKKEAIDKAPPAKIDDEPVVVDDRKK